MNMDKSSSNNVTNEIKDTPSNNLFTKDLLDALDIFIGPPLTPRVNKYFSNPPPPSPMALPNNDHH